MDSCNLRSLTIQNKRSKLFSNQCVISMCCLTVPALLTALQRSSLRRSRRPQAMGLEATTQPRTLRYTAAHQEQSSLESCDQERSCGSSTHHSSSSHNEFASVPRRSKLQPMLRHCWWHVVLAKESLERIIRWHIPATCRVLRGCK